MVLGLKLRLRCRLCMCLMLESLAGQICGSPDGMLYVYRNFWKGVMSSPFPPGSSVSPASLLSPRRTKICQAPSSHGHSTKINGGGTATEEVVQQGPGWFSEAETH